MKFTLHDSLVLNKIGYIKDESMRKEVEIKLREDVLLLKNHLAGSFVNPLGGRIGYLRKYVLLYLNLVWDMESISIMG